MTTRWARFARGWIAAIVSLFIATCSHALAGGALPATAVLALCLAFSGAVCVLLAGKTLSLARLSIAVALSQLLFHGLFSLLADAPLGTPALAGVGMHHGGGSMVLQLGSATSTVPQMRADADPRMWVGHAIGAVITIAALSFGERAFWGLVRLTRLCISRILDSVLPVETLVTALPRQADRAIVAIARSLMFSIHRHRGPPAFASAP
jgi:hypothetical protein